jgi:prepilin-type processing-associated H-X9-DG protein
MRTPSQNNRTTALTLIEIFVILAVLAVAALLILPQLTGPTRSPIIHCRNNLKQIGLAALTWELDQTNRFPPQVSTNDGGSMEMINAGSPAPHFQAVSNEVADPRILHCPLDNKRHAATNFGFGFGDLNISYFFNVDAKPESPSIILAGDRKLALADQPLRPGLAAISSNAPLAWARDLHYGRASSQSGNILFADGHVEGRITNLSVLIQQQGMATFRLAIP